MINSNMDFTERIEACYQPIKEHFLANKIFTAIDSSISSAIKVTMAGYSGIDRLHILKLAKKEHGINLERFMPSVRLYIKKFEESIEGNKNGK